MNSIVNQINEKGYVVIEAFTAEHISTIKSIIKSTTSEITGNIDLFNAILNDKEHYRIREKRTRTLPEAALKDLIKKGLLIEIEKALSAAVRITDEENFGYPEVYWRYVRPNRADDIGPIHADGWFWDINPNWRMPQFTKDRIKVWAPLQCTKRQAGLLIVPNSHKNRKQNYTVIEFFDKKKPVITKEEGNLGAVLIDLEIGQCILFHDRLLHGGSLTLGEKPRVSFEFTIAI